MVAVNVLSGDGYREDPLAANDVAEPVRVWGCQHETTHPLHRIEFG